MKGGECAYSSHAALYAFGSFVPLLMHSDTHARMRMQKRVHILTPTISTHTRTHMRPNAHERLRSRAHTHTQTHTHKCMCGNMQVMDIEDPNMGYNAASGEFCDLVKAGIIDPLKVRGGCRTCCVCGLT